MEEKLTDKLMRLVTLYTAYRYMAIALREAIYRLELDRPHIPDWADKLDETISAMNDALETLVSECERIAEEIDEVATSLRAAEGEW